MSVQQAERLLADCRRELHAARALRPRTSCDDKVVAAWNGQGIGAFALAAVALAAEQPPAGELFPVDGCEPGGWRLWRLWLLLFL